MICCKNVIDLASLKKKRLNVSVGIKGPEMGIEPWAMSKDIKTSENR